MKHETQLPGASADRSQASRGAAQAIPGSVTFNRFQDPLPHENYTPRTCVVPIYIHLYDLANILY